MLGSLYIFSELVTWPWAWPDTLSSLALLILKKIRHEITLN